MDQFEHEEFGPSEFPRRNPGRRATDIHGPTLADLMKVLETIKHDVARVNTNLTSINSSFPLNDIGQPDYDGHRKDHVHRIKAAETMEGYKVDATKKVLLWAVGAVLFLVSTGAIEHIKKVLGGQ